VATVPYGAKSRPTFSSRIYRSANWAFFLGVALIVVVFDLNHATLAADSDTACLVDFVRP